MTAVSPPMIDADEVRTALNPRAVLDFYGWQYRRSGDELESSACPIRSDHSRRAFLVNANSGRWRCFPCATSGDLFDFVAAAERLNVRNDFGAVLAKAAEIAGVGPSTLTEEQRRIRRAEWNFKRAQHEERERAARRERDRAAVPLATAYWEALQADHARGIEYLGERGIVHRDIKPSNIVRFDPKHAGSPSVPLYARDGAIRNVVVRRLPELGEPKSRGLTNCPTAGTLINAITDITAGVDVPVTEGVIDSVTARVIWPSGVVLGAHGASNLPKIAKLAAPIVAAVGARMLIVAHRDGTGFDLAADACRIAVDAGLSVRRGTLVIVKHGEKDLNEAWCNGWRPSS